MKNLIKSAFEKPVNFPPLCQTVFPGDNVVIAPDSFVACRPVLLAEFVSQIIEVGGVAANEFSVLLLEHETKLYEPAIKEALPEKIRQSVSIISHRPQLQSDLAMLAVAKNDSAIMLNRSLVNADVVIPIERYEAALGMGYFGMQSVIYPRFADAETQKRFLFAEAKKNSQKLLAKLADEVAEVVSSLGVLLTVQVVTNLHDEITQTIVGETEEIKKLLAKKKKVV